MGFLNPKHNQDDDQLPGSGRSIDLDTKVCPSCRRETLPWQERCADCDVVPVAPDEVPAEDIPLPPGLAALAAEDDDLPSSEADPDRGWEGGSDTGSDGGSDLAP